MMQVSKKVPFDDPQVLFGVRLLYVVSNLIIGGIYLYVQMQINKKKGTSKIMKHAKYQHEYSVDERDLLTASLLPDMKTIQYVEPAPMGSTEEPKLVTTTIHSYDLQQLKSLWKSQLMGVGMMGVMHVYFKYTNPLLIQSIIPLKGAFEGNLVKIHLFGQAATGDLARPWKAAGGFMGMGGDGPKTDKKSIEQAQKARSGGGAKEE